MERRRGSPTSPGVSCRDGPVSRGGCCSGGGGGGHRPGDRPRRSAGFTPASTGRGRHRRTAAARRSVPAAASSSAEAGSSAASWAAAENAYAPDGRRGSCRADHGCGAHSEAMGPTAVAGQGPWAQGHRRSSATDLRRTLPGARSRTTVVFFRRPLFPRPVRTLIALALSRLPPRRGRGRGANPAAFSRGTYQDARFPNAQPRTRPGPDPPRAEAGGRLRGHDEQDHEGATGPIRLSRPRWTKLWSSPSRRRRAGAGAGRGRASGSGFHPSTPSDPSPGYGNRGFVTVM